MAIGAPGGMNTPIRFQADTIWLRSWFSRFSALPAEKPVGDLESGYQQNNCQDDKVNRVQPGGGIQASLRS